MYQGDHSVAEENFNQALDSAKESDSKREMISSYLCLGNNHYFNNDLATATQYYEKALAISKGIGDLRLEGYSLSNAAEIYAKKGDLEIAEEYGLKGLDIFKKLDEKYMISNTYMVLGIICWSRWKWEEAEDHFNESIKISEQAGILKMLSQNYHEMGLMFKDKDDVQAAEQVLTKAKDAYERLDNVKKVEEIEGLLDRLKTE